MYRQPENHNRVKSIKSRFEGLSVPNNTSDKSKRSPVRNAVNKPAVNKLNNNKASEKSKQKTENNNNEYKINVDKKLSSNTMNQSIKISKDKPDVSKPSDRFKPVDKDFSDVHKKELCSIPPLNLTRQLNDPNKKGCIKRTPAFRKEKMNCKLKGNDEFSNIVKLFESNNDNLVVCDNTSSDRNSTFCTNTSSTNSNTKTATQYMKYTSTDSKTGKSECSSNNSHAHKMHLNSSDTNVDQSEDDTVDQSRTRKCEVTNVSALYKQKLSSKTNKSDSKDFDLIVKDKNVSLLHKQVVNSCDQSKIGLNSNMASVNVQTKVSPERPVVKQKLTSSISLILDSKSARSSKAVQLRKKSLSPKRSVYNNNDSKEFNLTSVSPIKIADREKRYSTKDTPLVKELIQNLSNKEHESLLNEHKENTAVKIPEYAQVVKPKKKEITTTGNTDISLTDTLKAALKQPLPVGPPPKKPPRTFAHTPNSKQKPDSRSEQAPSSPQPIADTAFCSKLNENLAQGLKTASETTPKPAKLKSDPKLMLQKLENALLSNRIRSPKLPKKIKSSLEPSASKSCTSSPQHGPQLNFYSPELPHKNLFPDCLPSLNCAKASSMNNYAKIVPNKPSTSSMSTFFTDCKADSDEPIYAEPFEHEAREDKPNFGLKKGFFKSDQRDRRADTLSNSLHYMVS